MASHCRHGRMCPVRVMQDPDLSPMWLYSREPELGFRRLGGPPSFFNQLMGEMQSRLDEMERMRVVLLDAYPLLALNEEGQARDGSLRVVRRTPSRGTGNCHFSLDVSGFSPDELTVKMDGRKLTVYGKHDKKTESEGGCFSHEYREVRREVVLPEDANLEAVTCALSQDGRLCIEVPRLALPPAEERTIPITIARAEEAIGEGAKWAAGEEADAAREK